MKAEKLMKIISMDAKKAFDNAKHLFMIKKSTQQERNVRNFSQYYQIHLPQTNCKYYAQWR